MTVRGAILITGASRGIGAAIARAAAAAGYAVGINYINSETAAQALADEISGAGGKAITLQADVSVSADVDRMFEVFDAELGTMAGLVNNAGIDGGASDFADLPLATMNSVVGTSLLGAMYCAQEAIRRMAISRGGNGGAIVNVSSQTATFGGNRISAYAAAKAGLNGFTVGLAREVIGDGVRVNAVSPGIVATDMFDQRSAADKERILSGLPIGRACTPDEIAATILWLLDGAPEYLSGTVVPVAGAR